MSGTFLTDSSAAGALSTHERDALLQRMAKLEQLVLSPGADGDLAHAANAGPFGLSASVWSSSVDTAHSLAHAIDAGYVWVNNWLARDLAMPFGGWKESGNGQRSGGLFDVDFFTYSKTTCVEITGRHAITGKAYA